MFETCQYTQTAGLFPPYCVDFPCNTQSIAASNRLVWRKKLSPLGIFPIFKQDLINKPNFVESIRSICVMSFLFRITFLLPVKVSPSKELQSVSRAFAIATNVGNPSFVWAFSI